MKKTALVLVFLMAALPVASAACAGGFDQVLFRAYSPANAHVGIWDPAVSPYLEELCYDAIFGVPYAGAAPHACTGSNTILKSYALTNSHVEQNAQSNYPIEICYGDLECGYVSSGGVGVPNCSSWDPDSKCIGTISSVTNAHFSTFCSGAGSYPIGVCCKSQATLAVCGNNIAEPGEECNEPGLNCLPSLECNLGTCRCEALPPEPFLKIVQFDASPLEFENQHGNFDSVVVKVRNTGSSVEALVSLEVLDPQTNKQLHDPVTGNPLAVVIPCGPIALGGECTRTLGDFTGFDVKNLKQGAYKLSASAWEFMPSSLADQKAVFFTVAQETAFVPELDFAFLPLIAFSVIAVLFLSRAKPLQ